MKRFLLVIFLLVVIGGIYLNRVYANVYNHIDTENLANTYEKTPKDVVVNSRIFDKKIRYVALGDSLTAGVGTEKYTETYPYILAQKIAESGGEVILNNLAVPGAIARDVALSHLGEALKLNPDVVSILVGTNDMHRFVSTKSFSLNMVFLINDLKRKTDAKIILINIPYLEQSELFSFVYKKYFDSRIQKYNEIIAEVARLNDLEIIDLYNYTKNNKPDFASDLFHVTGAEYKKWAELIYDNSY